MKEKRREGERRREKRKEGEKEREKNAGKDGEREKQREVMEMEKNILQNLKI